MISKKFEKVFEIQIDKFESLNNFSIEVIHKPSGSIYKLSNPQNVIIDSFLENILINLRDSKIKKLLV